DSGPCQGCFGRLEGEIGGALPLRRHVPLPDACTRDDPLIGGVEPGGELAIGDHALGQIPAAAQNQGPAKHQLAAAFGAASRSATYCSISRLIVSLNPCMT